MFGDATRQYYETICGGAGAGPDFDGQSAVHTHMTNTRMTDPEVLELRYPVVLQEFSIRRGSGGDGQWHGGDGHVGTRRNERRRVREQVAVCQRKRQREARKRLEGRDGVKVVVAVGAVCRDAHTVGRAFAFAPRVPVVLPVMTEIVVQQRMLALDIAVVRQLGAPTRLVER